MTQNLLRIDASLRTNGSVSRQLSDEVISQLQPEQITTRDLTSPLPQLDEQWINANFTPEEDRTQEQRDALAISDQLVEELRAADTILIGVPIYNFSIPAALKGWIDLIARARLTFRYTENGTPEGLLKGKRAILVVASGGVEIGSPYDFATGYLRQVLGFVGITDVSIISADAMMARGEDGWVNAREQITQMAA